MLQENNNDAGMEEYEDSIMLAILPRTSFPLLLASTSSQVQAESYFICFVLSTFQINSQSNKKWKLMSFSSRFSRSSLFDWLIDPIRLSTSAYISIIRTTYLT